MANRTFPPAIPNSASALSFCNRPPPVHPGEIIKEDILPSVGLSVNLNTGNNGIIVVWLTM